MKESNNAAAVCIVSYSTLSPPSLLFLVVFPSICHHFYFTYRYERTEQRALKPKLRYAVGESDISLRLARYVMLGLYLYRCACVSVCLPVCVCVYVFACAP